MKIYAVRHGFSEFNKKGILNGQLDDKLSSEGIEDAKKLTLLLPAGIKHIYSSPLLRARQTAEILNGKLHVPLTFHDELKEVHFGVLEGKPFSDELREIYKSQKYDWRPSGESVEDVRKRVLAILKKISSENGDGEALIVAHGGIIRMLYLLETGTPLAAKDLGHSTVYSFDIDISHQ